MCNAIEVMDSRRLLKFGQISSAKHLSFYFSLPHISREIFLNSNAILPRILRNYFACQLVITEKKKFLAQCVFKFCCYRLYFPTLDKFQIFQRSTKGCKPQRATQKYKNYKFINFIRGLQKYF
jgi:hypothetical protein